MDNVNVKNYFTWAVVVTQLTEQLLSTLEDLGLSPVIGNTIWTITSAPLVAIYFAQEMMTCGHRNLIK